jgi:hypothetical protein
MNEDGGLGGGGGGGGGAYCDDGGTEWLSKSRIHREGKLSIKHRAPSGIGSADNHIFSHTIFPHVIRLAWITLNVHNYLPCSLNDLDQVIFPS